MTLLAAALLVLSDASGVKHDLADYKGKVVLLNFWATWCEPCKEELPGIEKLRASLQGKPFVVLAVQMKGSGRTAQDTAEALGLHFPLLLDRDGAVTAAWKVDLLPTSILIDRRGAVAWRHPGEMDWTRPAARRRIDRLMR